MAVASHGGYGDLGQYTISGMIVVSTNSVGAPSSLVAATQSTNQINLSWIDNATNETGFQVDQSLDGVTWTTIATLGADSTSFSDVKLTAGTSYVFRVSAFNATTVSDFSNVVTTATLAFAPANLTATAVSSSRIDLTWSDVGGATGYRIERSTDGTNWTQIWRSSNGGKSWTNIANVAANATSYADTSVTARKSYSYRVRTFNDAGNSAYSNIATATTPRASDFGGFSFGQPAPVVTQSQSVALPKSSASPTTVISAGSASLAASSRAADQVRDEAAARRDSTDSAASASSASEEPSSPTDAATPTNDFESLATVFSHPTLLSECLV